MLFLATQSSYQCRWPVSLCVLGIIALWFVLLPSDTLVASATENSRGDAQNEDDDYYHPFAAIRNVDNHSQQKQATKGWESVREYRRRLELPYEYEPQFVKDEVCRFIKDDECQALDKALELGSRHTKSVTKKTHHLKTLVILVQWQDHHNRTLISASEIKQLWNADGVDPILYPSGSMRDYIDKNSYGNLHIQAHVQDWQMTNGTEAFYGGGRYGYDRTDTQPELRQALYYVLDQMEQAGFPWQDFDDDGDKEIDSIMFMHSGYDAADGGMDCQTQNPMEDRIWSHASSDHLREDRWISPSTNITFGNFAITSVFRGHCDANIVRIGILGHEYLHTLGLPDLYDYDGNYQGGFGVGGLGAYDVMSNPAGPGHRPRVPGMLSPWSKLEMEWIRPIEITESGTYIARPSELYPDIYIIRKGYAENEYLMIENRQPISYDERMRGQGILIYHIDATDAPGGQIRGNRNRGFPGLAGWPGNGKHYPVALLQADGLYQIEKAIRDNDAGDFFHYQHRLAPGNGELEATEDGVYPNTDSYANGNIVSTGIVIDHFQEAGQAGVWSFRVTFAEETPAPTATPTDEPCRQVFELQLRTDGYARETSWELQDSQGHVIAEQGDWINDDEQERFEPATTYEEWICLDNKDEEYSFTVYDYWGDGMCNGSICRPRGWWKIWLNGEMVGEGSEFEDYLTNVFTTATFVE